MQLNARPFAKMKAGIKTIELRLNDEKRQKIMPGDTILFNVRGEPLETLRVEVMARLHYQTFQDLVFIYSPESMGYDDEYAAMYAAGDHGMYEHYSPSDEKQYGALGLKIRVV